MTEATSPGGIGRIIRGYFKEFEVLRDCPRDFWVVQLVNLLDAVAYFAMLTVATLYLSETLGYSDARAAYIWTACMLVYTGVGFAAGFVGDSLGVKTTLHLSVVLLVFSRLAIGLTTVKAVVIPALIVISVGSAIMTPILISATKRYTTAKSQTAGFNVLYFLMNVGAIGGNAMLDPLRHFSWGNRSTFLLGSGCSILCWAAILLFMRKRIAAADRSSPQAGSPPPAAKPLAAEAAVTGVGGAAEAAVLDYARAVAEPPPPKPEKWEAPWTIAFSVFGETAFWRFMLFLVILTGVRLVFEHQSQIYPKYYLRTMGAATPVGLLNAINPFIICFGVIISTPIVAKYKLFNVMYVGIVCSALSMLFLAIDPRWFAGPLGLSLSQGYYVIILLQIGLFSVGEVIWSPRLYEYTAAIAPPGREASYMGLSSLPMFLARLAEGPLAAFVLTRYCPPDIPERLATVPYSRSPQFMSLILAALALTTPILIVLLRPVLHKEGSLRRAAG